MQNNIFALFLWVIAAQRSFSHLIEFAESRQEVKTAGGLAIQRNKPIVDTQSFQSYNVASANHTSDPSGENSYFVASLANINDVIVISFQEHFSQSKK